MSEPLYDRIGRGYDRTRKPDPRIAATVLHHLAPEHDGRYVDVACGTGNYTAVFAAGPGRWVGVDPSERMLAAARARLSGVELHRTDAASLPGLGRFDGATCTLAIHHFTDLPAALGGIRQALGRGRLVTFTSFPEQMERYWLCRYFPDAMRRSRERLPALERVRAILLEVGFSSVEVQPWDVPPDLEDLFLYAGKHRPAIYFDAQIRAGMSTFASLVEPAELERGLSHLEADVASGRIREVIAQSQHQLGDYAFVVADS